MAEGVEWKVTCWISQGLCGLFLSSPVQLADSRAAARLLKSRLKWKKRRGVELNACLP